MLSQRATPVGGPCSDVQYIGPDAPRLHELSTSDAVLVLRDSEERGS